ncbi:MAG: hypothetical protein FJY10_02675 [Bacteroidetes bacterium]|nr:hypothetical protein [Bacteroidota bacterium]
MSLEGAEFLRRFSQHIMPRRFVRIRYYGMLSSTRKASFRDLQISMGIAPSVSNKKKTRKPSKSYETPAKNLLSYVIMSKNCQKYLSHFFSFLI